MTGVHAAVRVDAGLGAGVCIFREYCYAKLTDSARDRFLAPNGLMAPSQTRLVISGITGERVWRERVEFWKGVYGESIFGRTLGRHSCAGFDMTTMDSVYFNEGMVEYVDAKEIVTDEIVVRVSSLPYTQSTSEAHTRISTRTTPRPSPSTSPPASSWSRASRPPSVPS